MELMKLSKLLLSLLREEYVFFIFLLYFLDHFRVLTTARYSLFAAHPLCSHVPPLEFLPCVVRELSFRYGFLEDGERSSRGGGGITRKIQPDT